MPKILIIDDNDDLRDTLVVMLEDQGYSVISAGDGKTGVHAFDQARPDLVLTDIIMPNSDGVEAIRRIRAIDPKARIVAMSGGSISGNEYQLRMAKEAGAIEVLAKPFEVDDLVAVVERCLKSLAGSFAVSIAVVLVTSWFGSTYHPSMTVAADERRGSTGPGSVSSWRTVDSNSVASNGLGRISSAPSRRATCRKSTLTSRPPPEIARIFTSASA